MKVVEERHTALSFRLNAFLNCTISRVSRSSPTCGNFVLTMAAIAAYIGVKGKLAAWDFMMLRQNNPRPLTKFSPNSSGTINFIFDTLTLLIRPLIDFLRASQAMR